MKFFFAAAENHNIIHVTEVMLHPLFFLDPVVKIRKIEVSAILGKIVSYRYSGFFINIFIKEPKITNIFNVSGANAIYDFIQQPKQFTIFEKPSELCFQNIVIY